MNGWLRGATATIIVGASFPISQALVDYPYATGQMIRYAIGALILVALLKGRLGLATPRELALLGLVSAVGMVGFNLAVLAAVDRVGATNVGVIVGASPVLLALITRTRNVGVPVVVFAGAAVVNGIEADVALLGTALAVAALLAEI